MVPAHPLTVAEASGWKATSRHADVLRFIDELKPRARHLSVQSMGRSGLGQELVVLVLSAQDAFTPAAAHATGKPVVMVLANIHAGEVEGKESLLALARDITTGPNESGPPGSGPLARLMEQAVLLFVPNYNCDGNDRIDPRNRPLDLAKLEGQIGPKQGVGTRNTAQGFNLNRDYIKLEAPESRHLMDLWHSWRPHLTIDCHTTNGSIHGYHLTFDTAHLIPSSPPAPILHVRDVLLPAIARSLEARTGFRTGFYGNFRDQDDPTKGWESYPGLPRFGSHYRGLTGRMDVLLECYSYIDFKQRCDVMYATLVELLDYVNLHGSAIRQIVEEAETETIRRGAEPRPDDWVGVDYSELTSSPDGGVLVTYPMHPLRGEIEVCAWDLEAQRARRVPGRELTKYRTPWYARFVPTRLVRRPFAYLIPASEIPLVDHLRRHHLTLLPLARAEELAVEQFVVDGRTFTSSRDIVDSAEKAPRETIFFGHREVATRRVQPGDFVLPMAQPLAHVALYLLEPESDDGLVRWGFFDRLQPGECFPVLRLPRRHPFEGGV